jgi:hypothetical protein
MLGMRWSHTMTCTAVQGQHLEAFGRRAGREDLVAVGTEQAVQRRQHVDVVVDDQQGLRRLGGRVVAGRQAARRRRSSAPAPAAAGRG